MMPAAATAIASSWGVLCREGAPRRFELAAWIEALAVSFREEFGVDAGLRGAFLAFVAELPGTSGLELRRVNERVRRLLTSENVPLAVLPRAAQRMASEPRGRLLGALDEAISHLVDESGDGAGALPAIRRMLESPAPLPTDLRRFPKTAPLLQAKRAIQLRPPMPASDDSKLETRVAEVQQATDAMIEAIGVNGAAFAEVARQSYHPLVLALLAEVRRRDHWPVAELAQFLDAFDFTIEALEVASASLCGGKNWLGPCRTHAGCVHVRAEAAARMAN